MTTMFAQRQNTQSNFDTIDSREFRIVNSPSGGLTTSYTTAGAVACDANEIAFIDSITFQALTNDAATNLTVTLKVNTVEMPFHFAGTANQRHNQRRVWNTNGNLVVRPSMTFQAKASVASVASISVRYRKMSLGQAHALGLISPSLPNVASTVTAGGYTTGTPEALIAASAGYAIEILGFACTGHNYNAAADSLAMGFWDGATGTFYTAPATQSAAASMVYVHHFRGASANYAANVFIGDTGGCIQGPVGQGLWFDGTANIDGATPTADFVVLYRYIKVPENVVATTLQTTLDGVSTSVVVAAGAIPANTPTVGKLRITIRAGTITTVDYHAYSGDTFTIPSTDFTDPGDATAGARVEIVSYNHEVNDCRGKVNKAVTRPKKFWACTLTDPTLLVTQDSEQLFGSYKADALVKFGGFVGSYVSTDATTFAGLGGLGLGKTNLTSVGLYPFLALQGDDPNAVAPVSNQHYSEQPALCNLSQIPSLIAAEETAGDVSARCQLVWGTIKPYYSTTIWASGSPSTSPPFISIMA